MVSWKVQREQTGMLLSFFLQEKLGKERSAKSIKRLLDQGMCLLNGRYERFGKMKVAAGDEVTILEAEVSEIKKSVKIKLADCILYEDDSFICLDKPAGVTSDENGVIAQLKPLRGHLFLGHRLDKDTTGVLILAKNEAMAECIREAFRKREVSKAYIAIVRGKPPGSEGVIDNFLVPKAKYQGQTLWQNALEKGGKGVTAYTAWRLLEEGKHVSCVLCEPKTGRTHQLRVHMNGLGCPIIGDRQYGNDKILPREIVPARCMLHAYKAAFIHPKTGKRIEVKAELPQDMKEVLVKAGLTRVR